jgi:hypothetical protein
MDDPGKMLEQNVAESNEVMALRASVAEGKRLLRIAISQRETLVARNTAMWKLLRQVRRHWVFRFLPSTLRETIENECGRAD